MTLLKSIAVNTLSAVLLTKAIWLTKEIVNIANKGRIGNEQDQQTKETVCSSLSFLLKTGKKRKNKERIKKKGTMTEERQWKRPDQVETFRTSDPKEMLHKYLPKHVLKTWKEDFIDEDTHEVVTIERNEVIVDSGEITQDKLQQIMFAIQAGDIEDGAFGSQAETLQQIAEVFGMSIDIVDDRLVGLDKLKTFT